MGVAGLQDGVLYDGGLQTTLTSRGRQPEWSPFGGLCPTGQLVCGVRTRANAGWIYTSLTGLELDCCSVDSGANHGFRSGATNACKNVPAAEGSGSECACPAGQYVTGFRLQEHNGHVSGLEFDCKPVCPAGHRVVQGWCVPCALGETYQDEWNMADTCKRVAPCQSGNAFQLFGPTLTSDFVCITYFHVALLALLTLVVLFFTSPDFGSLVLSLAFTCASALARRVDRRLMPHTLALQEGWPAIFCCQRLTWLPESLGQLTALTTLDLSGCRNLHSLPESLGQLTALATLTGRGNGALTRLPESLGGLVALETLDLCECSQLTGLPESLGRLTSLTTLDLSRCRNLHSLPESLGQLTALATLTGRGNGALTRLPESLGGLVALETLDLCECSQLTGLPESLGRLTSLTTLDICRCAALTCLPVSLGQLTALRSLSAQGSGLTCLPESLGELTALHTLDLGSCVVLTCLPTSTGQLVALTNLNLARCAALPDRVNDWTRLLLRANHQLLELRRRQLLLVTLGWRQKAGARPPPELWRLIDRLLDLDHAPLRQTPVVA